VGIGLRKVLHEPVHQTSRGIDWLEIIAENFMGLGGYADAVLSRCRERWPILAHGVALSVGGPDPFDDYLEALRPLLDRIDPPFFTDHLCWSQARGHPTFDLLPLPFCQEAVDHVVRRVRAAEARLDRPLVLENITYYATMPGSTMSEPSFVRAVLEEADCGLLLDLNNLLVNAKNRGEDANAMLDAYPLARVRQVHLAGHSREGDLWLDTHDGRVAPEVWRLYRRLVSRIGPVPTLIEWDQGIPSLDAVLDEADRARAICADVISNVSSSPHAEAP